MTTTPKLIIFTDLDGSLLDRETYSFQAALPALRVIRHRGIPLLLVSSKTRAEMELYRKRLGIHHPFISENGGAIFIPKNYFSFHCPFNRESGEYFILEFGASYSEILLTLDSVRKETGISIQGFSDLTVREIARLCAISEKEAELSKRREYDEPFLIRGGREAVDIIKQKIQEKGMIYAWGGRFHHILGKSDKGKAVRVMGRLFKNEYSSTTTIGIGDSENDLPMLRSVDHPFFLRGEEAKTHVAGMSNLTIVDGSGPQAWNRVIVDYVS
jgi:mannosyl-3-phosphoglycerate phosphatase